MPPPSIRSLARQLGLSAATVSLALRDSPRVIAPTKRRELGYSLSLCWVGPKLLTLPRLNAILATRNVRGLVVLPFRETLDFSALDWSRVAGVVMDYCLCTPRLHTVLPDHQSSLVTALQRLACQQLARAR